MTDEDHLGRTIEFAARKLQQIEGTGAIFVLLDADSDCPAELAPQLLQAARQVRPDISKSVVVAKTEYEAWFLAAANSLRIRGSIRPDAEAPENPEEIRNAKGYLQNRLMVEGATYSETVDQPALTSLFDFEQALVCPSFAKLRRDLDALFREVH